MDRVRLLTLNTLFRDNAPARLRALGEILERSDYDVVCLQEVMSPANLRALRRITRSYDHAAHAATFPVVRGGLVTLSRWPITSRHFATFRPMAPPRPEWLMRKGVLVAHIQIAGHRLTIVNTHLSANRDDDWSLANPYARVQAAELRHLERTLATIPSSALLVAMGDFNVPRGSQLFTDFVATTGLRDALAGEAEPTYRPTPGYPDPPAIDQILLRAPASHDLTVKTRLIFQEAVSLADGRTAYLSDHYGIEAELKLRSVGL